MLIVHVLSNEGNNKNAKVEQFQRGRDFSTCLHDQWLITSYAPHKRAIQEQNYIWFNNNKRASFIVHLFISVVLVECIHLRGGRLFGTISS